MSIGGRFVILHILLFQLLSRLLKAPKRKIKLRGPMEARWHGKAWTKVQSIMTMPRTFAVLRRQKNGICYLALDFAPRLWERMGFWLNGSQLYPTITRLQHSLELRFQKVLVVSCVAALSDTQVPKKIYGRSAT
ncbi:hypothetical protein MGG_16878 [Pyricularia oryzae 70-15]|uniref:Secreted protein n=2 Tax=Pyricularia oryzae TaxID=318829 RepID=G4N503_PYRO7|nr:uncharacterized protein MGG_16878 [Pyricularia oryzae 70-15]EHA52914.1 hypothetical protein MGG_16878 [Pyricularia oryzae 70-15]ELQ39034.1 hypothetical protein OOU_Y34scaffold00516g69 [Pyricularia oryzae Y34]